MYLTLLTVAMMTSCTTTSTGRAEPTPGGTHAEQTTETRTTTTEPEPSDQLPSDGAPAVKNSLDTKEFQLAPCRMLTERQVTRLNIDPPGDPFDSPLGNRCRWENPEIHGQVEIGFDEVTGRGLSAVYAANNDGDYAYFDELPAIHGYPAVANDVVDGRDDGACAVVVGVSDEVTFDVSLQLSVANMGEKEPCDMAATIAEMAVNTVREGVH